MRILLLLFLLSPFSALAVEQDKITHATGSYVLTDVCLESGYSKTKCFVASMFIGFVKETTDNNTSEEHRKDMLANLAGTTGALLTFKWNF